MTITTDEADEVRWSDDVSTPVSVLDAERDRVAWRFMSALFCLVFIAETTWAAYIGAWVTVPIGALGACAYAIRWSLARRAVSPLTDAPKEK